MDRRFHCPFVMQVVGPSCSGKSSFVGRLLRYSAQLFDQPVDRVTWFSPHGHLPKELTEGGEPLGFSLHVKTALGEEDVDMEGGGDGHHVMVIDDFGSELRNSDAVTRLYTKGSHHRGITVIQILQNLFMQGKETRTRSLNIHYLVLMRQTRDISQVRQLARQVTASERSRAGFLESYEDAVGQRSYAYLLVTFHPMAPRELLLRTNIFPDEQPHDMVYLLPEHGTEKYKKAGI